MNNKETFTTINIKSINDGKIITMRDQFKFTDILAIQETHGERKDIRGWVRKLGFEGGEFSLAQKQKV